MILLAGCTGVTPTETLGPGTYNLTVTATDDAPSAGQAWNFTLLIEGGIEASSDHIGGHFWDFATDDPTGDFSLAGGCAHVPGGGTLPNTFQITCTFDEAGTYYLHGHVRITGEETFNYWSDEIVVNVA
jgi:hypothetical protein